MVNQYGMIMIPILFFLIANFIFSASYTQQDLDDQIDIITDPTWPTPGSTWYGQTDFLGYFVDTVASFLERVVAVFTLIFIVLSPPAEIGASSVFSFIISIYVAMYVMLGIGIYKVLTPFA